MSYNNSESVPLPRNRVFVLQNGEFVVQWESHRVQDLINGRYYAYDEESYGSSISDWELTQLRARGVVYDFDDNTVYLNAHLDTVMPATNARSFYVNTLHPKSEQAQLQKALIEAGLQNDYAVRLQDYYLIIRGQNGMAFNTFDEAERARETLNKRAPEWFGRCVIAFVEVVTE